MHLYQPRTKPGHNGPRRSIKRLRKLLKRVKKSISKQVPTPAAAAVASPQPNIQEHIENQVVQVYNALENADFGLFLQSDLGGGKKTRDSVRILRNTARFLLWSHEEHNTESLQPEGALLWLKEIITREYRLLHKYSLHLTNALRYSSSTVRNHTGDIVNACEWFLIYASDPNELSPECIVRIRHVAASIRKVQVKREKNKRSRCTMDSKIRERRMPSNGLPELQEAVRGQLTWALSLTEHDIYKESYKLFMGVLYSALYVFSAQGRISGVMDMSYGQARDLLGTGYSTTDQFKTNQRWGLQPVTLSVTTVQLLQHYLAHVRPRVCIQDKPSDTDALWLAYNGLPDHNAGTNLTAFFKRTLGLHITTTAIRSLVETSMSELHDKGVISGQQMQSVQAINGHTSAVANDYYVHKARGADVAHARKAFEYIVPQFDAQQGNLVISDGGVLHPLASSSTAHGTGQAAHATAEEWNQPFMPVALDFGTAHPDYGTKAKKAKWTDEEINYIGEFCKRHKETHPLCTTMVADCLEFILTDPIALPIFHAIHVLDSGRLRNGYRNWLETQKKLLSQPVNAF